MLLCNLRISSETFQFSLYKTAISNTLCFTFTQGSSGNCDREEVDLNVDFFEFNMKEFY